jgi:hypothetical protein
MVIYLSLILLLKFCNAYIPFIFTRMRILLDIYTLSTYPLEITRSIICLLRKELFRKLCTFYRGSSCFQGITP